MSTVITGKKITSLPRWTAIINTRQSSARTHTLPHCTHNRWWLVLDWVTTKKDHPRLRIAYISYIWRVIKFYSLTYLHLLSRYTHTQKTMCQLQQKICPFVSILWTQIQNTHNKDSFYVEYDRSVLFAKHEKTWHCVLTTEQMNNHVIHSPKQKNHRRKHD